MRSFPFSLRAMLGAVVVLLWNCGGWSAAAPPEDQIGAHLIAGEFGPALRLAETLPAGAAKDRALAAIAQAQAQGGATSPSLATLRSIDDDALRQQTAANIAARGRTPQAGRGGGVEPDFEALMDLIQSTIAPDTWTGKGAIKEFAGGVWVDARGELLRRGTVAAEGGGLSALRVRGLASSGGGTSDVRKSVPLRMISLSRLERQLQAQHALGKGPDEFQRYLAGLHHIRYVLLYPETHDIVLAGPAGDWTTSSEGRIVDRESGEPVVQLDDWIVALRNAFSGDGKFGCTITPSRENLVRAQEFLSGPGKAPLKSGELETWAGKLRESVGKQNVEIYGVEGSTRIARVIVEADYRLKLVGLGLEEGVLGVDNYFDNIKLSADGKPPALGLLRWWFTLNYQALSATTDHLAFEIRGGGVKVQSENEHLTAQGEREHTGQSDELNHRFASSFTAHFPALAAKYPIYAELRNVFDLAMVAALLKAEGAAEKVGWKPAYFLDESGCPVGAGATPKQVLSVVNSRVLGGKHVLAAVSGGVTVDARPLVARSAQQAETYGKLRAERDRARPTELKPDQWWWDP